MHVLRQTQDKFRNFFNGVNNKKKIFSFLCTVFILIIFTAVFSAGSAHAAGEEITDVLLGHIVYPLLYLIFFILFYVAKLIAWFGAELISANLNPALMNSVLASPGVLQGWQIFRDVANLLFILILLLVAFGTIFRSGTYNIKKSLPTLIIVAFLINFSMMITGIVIDFTNILMYGILKMMCSGNSQCLQDFTSMLMRSIDDLDRTYTLSGSVQGFISWSGISVQSVVGMIIATIYTFIYGLVLMALAVFLLIRVAAFALLIILSPLAFFGEIAPGLKGISTKWWDNLLQYAFFGPIFELLLFVTGLMATTTFTVGATAISRNPDLSAFTGLFATIIANVIPLLFLLAIIPITKAMGIEGASAVMDKTVGFGTGLAVGTAKYMGNAADRYLARGAGMTAHKDDGRVMSAYKWGRRGLSTASPGSWKRAWKERQRIEEGDYKMATGRIQGGMGWGARGQASPADDAGVRDAREQLKELDIRNADELADKIAEAIKKGEKYMSAEGMRTLASTGDIEKILDRMYGSHEAKDYNRLMNEEIKPMWGDKETAKLSGEIGKLEEKNGHYIYNGHGDYDPKRGEGKEYYMHDMFQRNPDGSIKQENGNNLMNNNEVNAQKTAMLSRWNSKDEFGRIRSIGRTNFEGRKDKNGKETASEEGAILLAELKGKEALERVKGLGVKVSRFVESTYGAEFDKVSANKKNESIFKNMETQDIATVKAVYDRIKQNSEGKGDGKKEKEDEDEDEDQRRQDEENQA